MYGKITIHWNSEIINVFSINAKFNSSLEMVIDLLSVWLEAIFSSLILSNSLNDSAKLILENSCMKLSI